MVNITSEIFEKSQCLEKEEQTIREIEEVLIAADFTQSNRYTWQRGNKTVIVRLVDDFTNICGKNWVENFPCGLNVDTLVITDNFVNSITQFEVMRLPDSFFGIYYYEPTKKVFAPDRVCSLQINRADAFRLTAMLTLVHLLADCDLHELDQHAYLSFNGIIANTDSRHLPDSTDLHLNLLDMWHSLEHELKVHFHRAYTTIGCHLPYKNFNLDFNDVAYKAWINIVMETYINDRVISLSEKTFRALVSPVPSIIHGSKYTSVWLRKLGFMLPDDFVDQSFDQYCSVSVGTLKTKECASMALASARRMQHAEFSKVINCLNDCAQHNINVLQTLALHRLADFARWKTQLEEKLKKWY